MDERLADMAKRFNQAENWHRVAATCVYVVKPAVTGKVLPDAVGWMQRN